MSFSPKLRFCGIFGQRWIQKSWINIRYQVNLPCNISQQTKTLEHYILFLGSNEKKQGPTGSSLEIYQVCQMLALFFLWMGSKRVKVFIPFFLFGGGRGGKVFFASVIMTFFQKCELKTHPNHWHETFEYVARSSWMELDVPN